MAAKDMIHVVYPYAEDRYQAVVVHKNVGTARIHEAIANFENNEQKSGRRWKAVIEPGSFNIQKIEGAESAAQAIEMAKEKGLAYEPKPVVLKRRQIELSAARKAFEDIGRMAGGQRQSPTGGTNIDDLFKSVFGDSFKPR